MTPVQKPRTLELNKKSIGFFDGRSKDQVWSCTYSGACTPDCTGSCYDTVGP